MSIITSFIIIIIFYTLLILSIVTTNGSVVDDICGPTKNPKLCIDALGSPESYSSDLKDLGLAGLETGVSGSLTCERKFLNLTVSSPRPDLRDLFIQCEKLYEDAYESLTAARQAAKMFERWDHVVPNVLPVYADVDQCEDLFTNASPVKLLGAKVRVAAEAIIFIADRLIP